MDTYYRNPKTTKTGLNSKYVKWESKGAIVIDGKWYKLKSYGRTKEESIHSFYFQAIHTIQNIVNEQHPTFAENI